MRRSFPIRHFHGLVLTACPHWITRGAAWGGAETSLCRSNRFPFTRLRNMAAKIHLERMMHRSSIAVAGESAASYALVKLIPSGLGQVSKPMGLNLALVIDVSGSMY